MESNLTEDPPHAHCAQNRRRGGGLAKPIPALKGTPSNKEQPSASVRSATMGVQGVGGHGGETQDSATESGSLWK